jgi:hypothetical protein
MGVVLVRQGKKYGLVNKKGQEVVPCEYDEVKIGAIDDESVKVIKDGVETTLSLVYQ